MTKKNINNHKSDKKKGLLGIIKKSVYPSDINKDSKVNNKKQDDPKTTEQVTVEEKHE